MNCPRLDWLGAGTFINRTPAARGVDPVFLQICIITRSARPHALISPMAQSELKRRPFYSSLKCHARCGKMFPFAVSPVLRSQEGKEFCPMKA